MALLSVAILGTGRMARTHCARLAVMPEVELAAVVSRQGLDSTVLPGTERARRLKAPGDLKGLERPVDLALICLPSHLHRAVAEALMPHVAHIICEKPAALRYEDALHMCRMAEQTGCNLMVAQVLRAWDSYTALAAFLEERRETLHCVDLRRRQPRPAWSDGDWLLDRDKSGGILYDLAIHDIDFITSLYGAPHSVAGCLGPGGMSATLLLDYGRHCATIKTSWTLPKCYSAGLDVGAEVVFDDGLAVFGERPGVYRLYEGAGERAVTFPTWDPYARQLEQMVGYARRGERDNPFSIASTLPALAVCDQVQKRG